MPEGSNSALNSKRAAGRMGEQRPFVTDCNRPYLPSHQARQRAERAIKRRTWPRASFPPPTPRARFFCGTLPSIPTGCTAPVQTPHSPGPVPPTPTCCGAAARKGEDKGEDKGAGRAIIKNLGDRASFPLRRLVPRVLSQAPYQVSQPAAWPLPHPRPGEGLRTPREPRGYSRGSGARKVKRR